MPVKKIKTMMWITDHEFPCVDGDTLVFPSQLKYVFEHQVVKNCCDLLEKLALDLNSESENLMSVDLRIRSSLYVKLHPALGYFAGDTIMNLRSFHHKRDFLIAVEEAMQWVGDAGRYQGLSPDQIKNIQDTILELAESDDASVCGYVVYFGALLASRYDCWLNYDCIKAGLAVIIGNRTDVSVVDLRLFRLEAKDRLAKLQLMREMFERNSGIIVIPYNINNSHRCLLTVNWDTQTIIQFDPLQKRSVYSELSKLSRTLVAPLMSGMYAKFSQKQEIDLKQMDGFNCSLLVLMYVDKYLKGQATTTASKVVIKSHRLKYFVKSMEFFAPGIVVDLSCAGNL